MKYRLRLVILHTLIVSVILGIFTIAIYVSGSNIRTEEFDKRLNAEAALSYLTYNHITKVPVTLAREIQSYSPANLVESTKLILSDSGVVLSPAAGAVSFRPDPGLLKKAKLQGRVSFREGSRQGTVIYFAGLKPAGYAVMLAYDKYGILQIHRLRGIMIVSALMASLLIGCFSFIYIMKATKPLVKLGNQIKNIREGNLEERFDLGKGNLKDNEILQIADNFNSMLDRLQKSFDLQKSFVHHASHELRTPLAIMLTQTEAALRKNLSAAEAREVLQSLKEDQQEMIELTNSLLLLSQYERVDHAASLPLIRLDEIIYDTIEAIRRIFRDMNISVEFTQVPDNELNLSIKGNEILLRAAIRNLIKNAYQYSDDKNVSISIDADATYINILVKNSGKLLNEEDQLKLFVPFFRGANAQQKKGFGLGLSIVKRIVLLHSGDIVYYITGNSENCFRLSFQKQPA